MTKQVRPYDGYSTKSGIPWQHKISEAPPSSKGRESAVLYTLEEVFHTQKATNPLKIEVTHALGSNVNQVRYGALQDAERNIFSGDLGHRAKDAFQSLWNAHDMGKLTKLF